MIHARHWLDSPCSAALARGRAEAVLDQVTEAEPVLLYGAPLVGEALSLGAYQKPSLAVQDATRGAVPCTRRSSGGNTVFAGEGVFHFALALHDASALMDCPVGRILNRNVRGLLQGLRLLGVPAHYFGRDYVSVAARPGAYIAWDEREDGRVLFEAFIGHARSYVPDASMTAYPARENDPFRGHAPITLAEAAQRSITPEALFDHVVRGYAAMYSMDSSALVSTQITTTVERAEQITTSVTLNDDDALCWSAPYEEAIGFVYAGVRVASDKTVQEVRVGGDYFQNRLGQRAVEQQLIGCATDGTSIGRAINEVYADTRHVIEGIRQMDSIRAVVLAAVQRADSVS